jgi:hypothetical protein
MPRWLLGGDLDRFKQPGHTVAHEAGPNLDSKPFSNYSNCHRVVKYKSQASFAPKFTKLFMRVVCFIRNNVPFGRKSKFPT